MLLKVVTGNVAVLIIGLLLWRFFDFAGLPFALGVIFGTFLWHLAYRMHTGSWD